jgi:hypothetical protein
MIKSDSYITENPFRRWVIVSALNPAMAWSGSRWVPHVEGLPAGDAQISNFDGPVDAYSAAVKAKLKPFPYSIASDNSSITCFKCMSTSHHPVDVKEHYCGACHVFLDEDRPRVHG